MVTLHNMSVMLRLKDSKEIIIILLSLIYVIRQHSYLHILNVRCLKVVDFSFLSQRDTYIKLQQELKLQQVVGPLQKGMKYFGGKYNILMSSLCDLQSIYERDWSKFSIYIDFLTSVYCRYIIIMSKQSLIGIGTALEKTLMITAVIVMLFISNKQNKESRLSSSIHLRYPSALIFYP